jgi:hypothetical protein
MHVKASTAISFRREAAEHDVGYLRHGKGTGNLSQFIGRDWCLDESHVGAERRCAAEKPNFVVESRRILATKGSTKPRWHLRCFQHK